jgi:hypothetical protein
MIKNRIFFRSPDDAFITHRGLFQAVRSYLHFSQLSAWYSSSKGEQPKNVLFRITIPGETFASKFVCSSPPEEHFFPAAAVGRTSSVHVAVRSMPRSDVVPKVICPHTMQQKTVDKKEEGEEITAEEVATSGQARTMVGTEAFGEETKLAIAGSLAWREVNK